jgi:hypothetical protein
MFLFLSGTVVVYYHQNFAAVIFGWVFMAISYYKNPQLRKSKMVIYVAALPEA